MVPEDGKRRASVNHSFDDPQRFNLLGPAINEVTQENHFPGRMPVDPVDFDVAQFLE
ncbi:hypothetical protein D3C85_1692040 [compost metagenome]